jgi:hypothetical protein
MLAVEGAGDRLFLQAGSVTMGIAAMEPYQRCAIFRRAILGRNLEGDRLPRANADAVGIAG